MARAPMVTRTIKTTQVTALCVDIVTQETVSKVFTVSGTFKDNKSLMKALEKVANSDTEKVVHILSTDVVEKLYGMSEQDFISGAKVLPPRLATETK